jgi:hypothetical protein
MDRRDFVLGSVAAAGVMGVPAFAQEKAKQDAVQNAKGKLPEGLATSTTPPAAKAPEPIKPRHIMCFLGNWKSIEEVNIVVKALGKGFELDREFSIMKNDDRMKKAFEASADRVSPSMQADDWTAIEKHTAVAYILSPPIDREKSVQIAVQAMVMMSNMLRAGKAVALKHDTAGLAHGKTRWLEILDKARASKGQDVFAPMIEATVRRPIADKQALYSCGAQLLGVRDVEIVGEKDERKAAQMIDQLINAQLRAGYNAPAPEAMRLGMSGKAATIAVTRTKRYEEDDFFYNPYGYLRVKAS